jgi:hypothetical protein
MTNDEKEFYIRLCGWRKSTEFDIDGTIYQWVPENRPSMFPVSLEYAFK